MMRFHRNQVPEKRRSENFLKEEKHGNLSLIDNGKLLAGIQNYFMADGAIVLHLGKTDEQMKAIKKGSHCLFSIFKPYSIIPSQWIHKEYGGATNMCFKYQEYVCEVQIVDDEMPRYLNLMMDSFLEKGSWKLIEERPELYEVKMNMISVVALRPVEERVKWNFLQSKELGARKNIVDELRKRGEGRDIECADEMERWF